MVCTERKMENINPWLIRFGHKTETPLIRLFCFHFAGGSALSFKNWAKYLPENIELIAIQLPSRDGRYTEAALTETTQVVESIRQQILPYLTKPYIIFGHSLGALISYELLHDLNKPEIMPPALFIPSAYRAPHLPAKAKPAYTLPDKEFIARLEQFEGTSKVVLENQELMAAFLPRIRADFQILETYKYQQRPRLNTPILAIMGKDDPHVAKNELLDWEGHTQEKFRCHFFEGGHFFIHTAEQELMQMIRQECQTIIQSLLVNQQHTTNFQPHSPTSLKA